MSKTGQAFFRIDRYHMDMVIRVILMALSGSLCLPSYTMLASGDDHHDWISRKLLWTFLPPADFKRLGDTYSMKVHEIHIKDSVTDETILKTPRYQLVHDVCATLPADIACYIMMFYKRDKKEREIMRKIYMDSYRLHKIFMQESFISKEAYRGTPLYIMPEMVKGNVLRFRRLNYWGYFSSLQIIPSNGSKWEYDPRHERIGLNLFPGLLDEKISFNTVDKNTDGSCTSKFYTKSYPEPFKQLFFESKLGFVVQDERKNVHVFCTDLDINRIEACAQSMQALSSYERAIAYDFLKYNIQSPDDNDSGPVESGAPVESGVPAELVECKKSNASLRKCSVDGLKQTCILS